MRELIKAELNKGITQRELAGKIHFSHSTIQKILFTETKHSYEIRKKVADYFGVPVSSFYDEDPGQGSPGNPEVQRGGEVKMIPMTKYVDLVERYIACRDRLDDAEERIKQLLAASGKAARSMNGGT